MIHSKCPFLVRGATRCTNCMHRSKAPNTFMSVSVYSAYIKGNDTLKLFVIIVKGC